MKWLSRLSLAQAVRRALLWPVILALGVAAYLLWDRWSGGEWIIEAEVVPKGTLVVFSDYLPTVAVALLVVGPPIAFLLVWRIVRRG
jgi:hypothetical protein